jgi:N-acyl-D-amino-acid deacylase
MKRLIIFAALLGLLLVSCQPAITLPVTGDDTSGLQSYDRAFVELMERWEIPGGALAVMEEGDLVLARGYGFADVAREEPVRPESLFRIASVSKSITAVAILKLVEDGQLRLDDRAFALLDDLYPPDGYNVDPRIDTITIRQLLEHAGGWDANVSFDPMFMTDEIAQEMGVPAPADCATVIRFMLEQPLDFDPGSQYTYSNFGYCVLGRVIESVTGQSYEDYITQHILEPVGIENMRLGQSLMPDRHSNEVLYYDYEGAPLAASVFPDASEPVPQPYGGFCLEAMDAHGGWIGSATDLVYFVWAVESANPSAVLTPESLSMMVSRPEPPLWEGGSSYYALGWRVRPEGKSSSWWHTGSLPGTSAVLYRTSNGLIWAALFNSRPNTEGDEFLVDVITAMGRAALMAQLSRIAPLIMGALVGIGTVVGLLVWKRRQKRK